MHLPSNTIRFLCYADINKQKWDECVQSSDAPLLYASSLYLNGMCPDWDALVMNDYEAVMALPKNRKYGIRYVYSPYFVIGGGVFGKNIDASMILQFIKTIPLKFLYIDLDLNESNFFAAALKQNSISFKARTNTFLQLYENYETLFSRYSTLAKRKIKRAAKHNLHLHTSASAKTIIELYCRHYKGKDSVVDKFDFGDMISLLDTHLKNQTKSYLLTSANGDVRAFYLLLYDANYVYWLIGGSSEEGKSIGAFYYLTNQVIRGFAGTNRIFRFEGSDHPGIQFFNQQFGGYSVLYPRLTINRLPWPLRLLKP